MERVMGRQTDQQRGPAEWGSTKKEHDIKKYMYVL